MTPTENKKYILVIGNEKSKSYTMFQILDQEIYFCKNTKQARDRIVNHPPMAILIAIDFPDWLDFLNKLKNDLVFKHLPTILILSKDFYTSLTSLRNVPFDDWVNEDCSSIELNLRIHKCTNQMSHYLDASPLTRLPGNSSIAQKIKESMNDDGEYALAYLDIDNFKAFNDHYGFSLGDDLIRMTARLLVNEVERLSKKIKFVGHIGGDDFVFFMDASSLHDCCQSVIRSFDIICLSLIADKDQARGYIEIENRQGIVEKFPFPSVSLAVIDSRFTDLTHIGEVASIASELKKEAKKKKGSNYIIHKKS